MSSQKRIDQYFKSTSGNKTIIKSHKSVLNRPNPGRKLSFKNGSVSSQGFGNSSFGTQADEKKPWQPSNSSPEISTEDVVFVETIRGESDVSIGKSRVNSSITEGRSSNEKSPERDDSLSAINVTMPVKKTIRDFAMACNSPPLNLSPGKISLKRRNRDSLKMSSPPKKSLVFRENIAELPETHSKDISNSSRLPVSRESSFPCGNLAQGVKLDIVDVTDKNSPASYVRELNIVPKERKFGNFDKEIENSDSSVETREKGPNIQRNNTADDSQCYSNQIETEVTPKKRKIRALSSLRNSPSSSGWKVSVSIETPDCSMTALSSDWQKTLEESKDLARSSLNCVQGALKKNFQAILDSERNAEKLSEKCTSDRENSYNACLKKPSPRRNLFTPLNSAKKVRFEESNCVTSLPAMSVGNAVVSLADGATASPQGILQSTNLRTNGNLISSDKIIDVPNLTKKIIGPLKMPSETDESLNSSKKVNRTANLPTKINEIANSPTNVDGTAYSPTKIIRPSSWPPKVNETAISPTKIGPSNSPHKIINLPKSLTNVEGRFSSPTKRNELMATPTKSPSRRSMSSFSPRVKYSPQKAREERVDTHLATKAVENLNQAKQGIIPVNDFDLEGIYTKKSFEFEYGRLNTGTAVKYEARDVQVPQEKHGDHFFMVLVNVFSEPLNCGYFDEDELDTVFSILTLSPDAQSLLARMIKRKRGWHRVNSIKYPEIADDLKPIFRELVDHGFLDDDIANEDILRSLSLLQADEIRAVCQSMKINHKGTKPTLISDLMKLSTRKKALFAGMKSPSSALSERVNSMLGSCIRLPDRIENLLNRIFILLIPTQDPKENMAGAFRMLIQVHFGEKIFPATPKERFPIFRNRLHLIRYTEARSAWNQIINASEAKDWDTVRALGELAYDQLKPHFENNDSGNETSMLLPSHVKRFDANYVWVKVMSKSVEGFKKTKESMAIAAKFLHTLVSPSNKIPGNRTRWYGELAMIESYHRKNFETSANITINALMQEKLSEIDTAEMLDRARKLAKSRAVSTTTKERINVAVRLRQEMFISTSEPTVKEIEATMIASNTTGSKSTWSVNIGGTDTGYLRVEDVALRHYLGEGFRGGVHCEGALPVTIFATLLWDEIYSISVPGAFVSSYQTAPLDLYTSHFLEPRRERVENKIKLIRRLKLDDLSNIMHEDFARYRHYESLMHGNLFQNSDDFKDLIECLGMDAVVGICERLAGNYNQWKSGFPDLALWNPVTKKCKIVEVKGPGDSLSTKQRLWIQFLECLGVEVEVCVVKGTTKRYAT